MNYNAKVGILFFGLCCLFISFYYLKCSPKEVPNSVAHTLETNAGQLPPASSRVLVKPSSHRFLLKPEMKGATMLTRTPTAWSRDDVSCEGDKSFVKLEFKSPAGQTPLYVHPAESDKSISGILIKGQMWEKEFVNKIYNLLKREPDLQFLDLGANVGVYGITAAKLGRKVILVDPLLTNTRKLCNSVRDGYFSDVYVIRNALSSVGATHIRDATAKDKDTAYAVPLDDILDVFNFTKVAIKMDVEAHEHRVLKGAEKFFSKVDVRYILMEWREDKWSVKTGQSIFDFLARFKMAPFHPSTGKPLNPKGLLKFYGDVFWRKIA